MAVVESYNDPDDVGLPLDLKTVSHSDEAGTFTYTIETFDSFADQAAGFEWRIDNTGDRLSDLFITAEWGEDGEGLVGKVEDAAENELIDARITRKGPNRLAVTLPQSVLGAVSSYDYSILAHSDTNGNGEVDSGEQDLAPNVGLYRHRLSGGSGAGEKSAASAKPAPNASPAGWATEEPAAVTPAPNAAPTGETTPAVAAPAPEAASGESVEAAPATPAAPEAPTTLARSGASPLGMVLAGGGSALLGLRLLARRRRSR